MSSRRKRARSPIEGVAIPAEDCTRDTFDQHANLSDRQFLCWALQTEARVRFAKLEERDTCSSVGESTTLNSEYLLDLYPTNNDEMISSGPLARERYNYARKSLSYLQYMRDPDSSFETLTRLTIDRPQSNDLAKKTTREGPQYLPIPPNLLYFEIILEAFMGYRVPSFHSEDPAQPRAAIMGGAAVAVLTSWRDETVISIFKGKEKVIQEALEANDEEKYKSTKEEVRKALHRYFLHEDYNPNHPWWKSNNVSPNSPFSMGDVDVFLQASPLTQSLVKKMQHVPIEVRDIVCNNLGGSGFVHRDLQAYATSLCGGHLEPQFKDTEVNCWGQDSGQQFCYALTANGLSFALGAANKDDDFDATRERWPRTTQLIMLNEKADLVGGLMDFDISVASCAYDGVGVYATPRAAFSLKTLSQVVTPFVYEEKRNRSRIKKYCQRGFDAYIVDPYCSHDEQCVKENEIIFTKQSRDERNENAALEDENEKKSRLPQPVANESIKIVHLQNARWEALSLNGGDKYEAINEAQREDGWEERTIICNLSHSEHRHHDYQTDYSIALIEKRPGHAIEYFSRRDNWSEAQREEVAELPEHQRFSCRACRKEYGLSLVLDKAPAILTAEGTVEDVLHGEWSYRHSVGFCGGFDPSFYSGGAFSSYFVGENARSWYQLEGVMGSQQRIEEARYIRRHGTMDGFQERFVFDGDLESVFHDASNKNLSPSGRAPVGLNPERFIAKCKGCQEWLHECEFSVDYCERCEDSKPAAIMIDSVASERLLK